MDATIIPRSYKHCDVYGAHSTDGRVYPAYAQQPILQLDRTITRQNNVINIKSFHTTKAFPPRPILLNIINENVIMKISLGYKVLSCEECDGGICDAVGADDQCYTRIRKIARNPGKDNDGVVGAVARQHSRFRGS